MPSRKKDRRRHRRYILTRPINYYLSSKTIDSEEKVSIGKTINISHSGLSLNVSQTLKEGNKLRIPRYLIKKPYKTATVRWVKKERDDSFNVGLIFER